MLELLLISVVFGFIGWMGARLWTIILPFAFWLAFGLLGSVGVIPGTTSFNAAFLAGAVGALFAGVGMVARAQLRPVRSRRSF